MSDAKHDEELMHALSGVVIGLLSSGVRRLDGEPALAIMHKIEQGLASVRYVVSLAPFVVRVEIEEGGLIVYSCEFESATPRMGWIELGAGTLQ